MKGARTGGSGAEAQAAAARESLLEERDRYIAGAIAETLQDGEQGVLFIGAHHRVADLLPSDVMVRFVKDPARVGRYVQELMAGDEPAVLEELGRYVASTVEAEPS